MSRITTGIFLYILLTVTWVSTGYGEEPAESSQGVSDDSPNSRSAPSTIDVRRQGFYPEGKAWAVPIPEPKPPVIIGDYMPVGINSMYDERTQSLKCYRAADQLKARGRYAAAEQSYLQALKLRPEFPHAAYQLACNYALWHKPDKAYEYFDRACELGFSDYPFCYQDQELGTVRATKTFREKLKVIRENYLADSSKLVGTPVIFRPANNRSHDRFPTIFLLHGHSRTHEEHFDDAHQWSKLGFLAIAMPGSVPQQAGGFTWSQESIEVTHEQIQVVLRHPLVRDQADPRQVFVLGFSQGAVHAFQVVVLHPQRYAGVVPVGVGGRPRVITVDHVLSSEFKPRVWFVYGDGERGSKQYAQTWVKVCRGSGWKCEVTRHPGGHQFPDDWDRIRPQVATFLVAKE